MVGKPQYQGVKGMGLNRLLQRIREIDLWKGIRMGDYPLLKVSSAWSAKSLSI